ncbi:hypothetical protein M404DRAFT_441893 [Pisolithus tinctorius Marx 270]|uniref:Uncharacterized protein n=1 Tax=Pisolithus tinctorius Marx 270 TaxID=870435 RepID=A0A0C3KB55_PISTI|nr:hypothetical protein M404DRAFT_441893 [Pisolithus tinctorius Marx 270]
MKIRHRISHVRRPVGPSVNFEERDSDYSTIRAYMWNPHRYEPCQLTVLWCTSCKHGLMRIVALMSYYFRHLV